MSRNLSSSKLEEEPANDRLREQIDPSTPFIANPRIGGDRSPTSTRSRADRKRVDRDQGRERREIFPGGCWRDCRSRQTSSLIGDKVPECLAKQFALYSSQLSVDRVRGAVRMRGKRGRENIPSTQSTHPNRAFFHEQEFLTLRGYTHRRRCGSFTSSSPPRKGERLDKG